MITVDSSETVRDIKLELMKVFSVMPLDQHLSVEGKTLEDDQILGAAGVRPGSILLLKVSITLPHGLCKNFAPPYFNNLAVT